MNQPKKKFQKQTIKITMREKPYFQEILASVLGDFAFHSTVGGHSNLNWFTITHIPSGLGVIQKIEKKKNASELTRKLASLSSKWKPTLTRWENNGLDPCDYSKTFETKVKKTINAFMNQIR